MNLSICTFNVLCFSDKIIMSAVICVMVVFILSVAVQIIWFYVFYSALDLAVLVHWIVHEFYNISLS